MPESIPDNIGNLLTANNISKYGNNACHVYITCPPVFTKICRWRMSKKNGKKFQKYLKYEKKVAY